MQCQSPTNMLHYCLEKQFCFNVLNNIPEKEYTNEINSNNRQIMDVEYTWTVSMILRNNYRQFKLLTLMYIISGQFVYPVGGEGIGWN